MLAPGSRIGPYEVLAPLGAGGMGEVYRARDLTLRREVALKTLPEKVAREPNRLARLRREARILASLSHPGIATLHGLEESGDGVPVLVMELVRGETLADRLHRGGLPLKDVLVIGQQIADALAAAHEKGVLHRDLKPANISLTPEGRVKVLDFGLARALEEDEPDLHSQLSTATSPASDASRVLGTAPYMSPEQARGQEVDRRTDIWSFGCVLYELLTGKRAFPAATLSETVAAVLEREPDWRALPEGTPVALERLLRRSMKKDRAERLHDVADAGLELKELLGEFSSGSALASSSRPGVRRSSGWTSGSRRRTAMMAALAVAGGAVAGLTLYPWSPKATPALRQSRFQLALPRGVTIPGPVSGPSLLAISPDGEQIAFVGCKDESCLLYVRDRRELDARPLADTEGATCPFFSPDGRSIGFGSSGKLKTVSVNGGPVVTLADAASLRGASWGADGSILFTHGRGGILRVAAGGGEVKTLTQPDRQRENNHRWPQILPNGRAALFASVRTSIDHDVAVVDLATGQVRTLIENAGHPRYAPTGHILFGRHGAIYAVPFDPETLVLTGSPVPVLEDVLMWNSPAATRGEASGLVYYDLAQDGTLVFAPLESRLPKRTLVWADRRGARTPVLSSQRSYESLALSPDGRSLAVTTTWNATSTDVFVLDLERQTWMRVSSEGRTMLPAWFPDSSRLLAVTWGIKGPALLLTRIDGTGSPEVLLDEAAFHAAVAPDGRSLLVSRALRAPREWDLWQITLDGGRAVKPWLVTPSGELSPSFSPDGRSVAYCSNDSGRYEVYVRPYAPSGPRYQVSIDGGEAPRWSRDGREIFFVSRGSLRSVPVRTAPAFAAGAPRELFKVPDDVWQAFGFYDATPDGQRFVMVLKDPFEMRPIEVTIVPNWLEELKAKMAAAR